jgi:hypothetical protein
VLSSSNIRGSKCRTCEVNQRTEGRALERRYRSKEEGRVRTEVRVMMPVRIEVRIEVRPRRSIKVRMEAEWVPRIYLLVTKK